MKNSTFSDKLKNLKVNFQNSIHNVSRTNNKVDWSKEEIILDRLQHKLGKSKDEVTKLISKDLLDLLAMVPFSVEKEIE